MSHHILVVDDEAQIRELLCIYLMKQGFKVSTAATSEETIRFLANTAVDLVVLDIGLGEEPPLTIAVTRPLEVFRQAAVDGIHFNGSLA